MAVTDRTDRLKVALNKERDHSFGFPPQASKETIITMLECQIEMSRLLDHLIPDVSDDL